MPDIFYEHTQRRKRIEKEDRDMEELIPGNDIDHIWGSDDPVTDNLDIQDHADHLGALVR